MEIYTSQDGHVSKYIHDNGAETAIKTTPFNKFGGEYGKVTNKFNVFISTSVGCKVGCKFCYLTTKKCPHYKLTSSEITTNVISAIKHEIEINRPELKKLYVKLSWMGMGDVGLNMDKMSLATIKIIEILINDKLVKGIDGVDISTTMPKYIDYNYIVNLNNKLLEYNNYLNPARNYSSNKRSPVRFFYSLHSVYDNIRKKIIPVTIPISSTFMILEHLLEENITTIIHHVFFEGINDNITELNILKNVLLKNHINDIEVRILRFNRCEGTSFTESKNFNMLIDNLVKMEFNVKVQSSPGSEIKSACGEFLLSNIEQYNKN